MSKTKLSPKVRSEVAAAMGSKGGKARAAKMSPKARRDLARKAVSARWERIRQEANKSVAEATAAGAWGGMDVTPTPRSLANIERHLPPALHLLLYYVLQHTLGEKEQPEFVRTSIAEISKDLWWPEERIRWALTQLVDHGVLKVRNVGSGQKWEALLDVSPLIERWHKNLPELTTDVLIKDKKDHRFELSVLADREGPAVDFVCVINHSGRPLFAYPSSIEEGQINITITGKPIPSLLERRRLRHQDELKASPEPEERRRTE